MKIGQLFGMLGMLRKILNGGSIKKRSAETPRRDGPELDIFKLEDIINLEPMMFYVLRSVENHMTESLQVQLRQTAFSINGKRQDVLTQYEIQLCHQIIILANKCLVSEILKGRYPDAKWLPKLRKTIMRNKREIDEASPTILGNHERVMVFKWCTHTATILNHMSHESAQNVCSHS